MRVLGCLVGALVLTIWLVCTPMMAATAAASPVPDPPAIAPDQPLTVVITRLAKPGCTAALGRVLREVVDVQRAAEGHLSTDILPPREDGRDRRYQAIVKFADRAAWQRWLDAVRAHGLFARMNALTEGEPDFRYLTGLETWFTPPAASDGLRQPPRWKQATVVWLALFPLVVAVPAALGPVLAGVPGVLRTVVTTGTIVPLMTYFAVPQVSAWLDPWLYPRPAECLG